MPKLDIQAGETGASMLAIRAAIDKMIDEGIVIGREETPRFAPGRRMIHLNDVGEAKVRVLYL